MEDGLLDQFRLFEKYSNKLGDFWFYEGFVWAEMNEGIHLKMEDAKDVVALGYNYYENTGCYYVSNRVNSYSTEVSDFIPLQQLPFLKGFLMISHSKSSEIAAEVERLFFNKPFHIFYTKEEVIIWLQTKRLAQRID